MIEANKIQLFMRALARPLRSSTSPLKSDSGQAVLEYILVLVVSVGILLGVMYQFSTAFKKYVQSYFGEYVACLLETGELPTLGGSDGANAGICSASFEPFTLKNGRPLIATSGGNGDGNSDNGQTRGGGFKGSSSQRGGGSNSSKVTRSMLGRNGEAASSDNANGGSSKDGKKRIVKRYSSNSSFNFASKRQKEEGQIRLSDRFKMSGPEKEKKPFSASIDVSGAKGGLGSRSKKLSVDMRKFDKRKPASDVGLDLSFGDYVRYLIILGIVVMIILFFGGQLMQIKKNYEAG